MQRFLINYNGRKLYLITGLSQDEIDGAGHLGLKLDLSNSEQISKFSQLICPLICEDVLSTIEDQCLTEDDAYHLRKRQLQANAGKSLSRRELEAIPNGVEILEIELCKNHRGEIYVSSWVRDPLGRLWEVSPGRYVEGYHLFTGGLEKLGHEYAKLNDISLQAVKFIQI
jgi:hypothetical protein